MTPTMTMSIADSTQPVSLPVDPQYMDFALGICENSAARQQRQIALAAPIFDPELLQIGRKIAAAIARVSNQNVLLVNLDERLDPSNESRLTLAEALEGHAGHRQSTPAKECSAFGIVTSDSLKLASVQLLDRFDYVFWVLPPLLENLQGVIAARVIGQVCLALRTVDSTQGQLKRVREIADEEQFVIAGSILRETRRYLPRWVDRWLPAR